jgi:hypothetical protein
MSRQAKQRLVALLALTAILLFAYAAANHWHSTPIAAEHCQVCHVAHSLSVGVSGAALLLSPTTVARLVLPSRADLGLELRFSHVSPRAPPFVFPAA